MVKRRRLQRLSSSSWPIVWVLSVSLALAGLAYWQQGPSWSRFGLAAAASSLAVLTVSTVRRPRVLAALTTVMVVTVLGLAARETSTLSAMTEDWAAWSAAEREARATRVASELTDIGVQLRQITTSRLEDPAFIGAIRDGSPVTVSPPLSLAVESGILVFADGRLVAHAGQTHSEIQPFAPPGLRLDEGAFHTSLVAQARSTDGRIEVVATALVASAPPADRFARSILHSLAGRVDGAHTVVESPDSTRVVPGSTVVVVPDGPFRLARVVATTFTEGAIRLSIEEAARWRTTAGVLLALLGVLVVAWRRPAYTWHRVAAASAALVVLALLPLSALSNQSALFDPGSYFSQVGGPWSSTIAALLVSAGLLLAMVLFAIRGTSHRVPRPLAAMVVLAVAGGGPWLLRELARGIALPAEGAGMALWIGWQLALALSGTVLLLVFVASAHLVWRGGRGLPVLIGPLLALAIAAGAPIWLSPPGEWPGWYPALWAAPVLALVLSQRGVAQIASAAVIAGSGAVTLTWQATVRARVDLAAHDLARLDAVDDNALQLLDRFATTLRDGPGSLERTDALLRQFAASELAMAGYPARLARWSPLIIDQPETVLELVPVNDSIGAQAYLAMLARQSGTIEVRTVDDGPTTLLMAAVPAADGMVTTIAVPPRTRLLPADPFAAFTGVTGARPTPPPYRLELSAPALTDTMPRPLVWQRRGDALHGDGVAGDASGLRQVHVEVDLRRLDALVPRGALLVLIDVVAVLGVWLVTALADGGLGRLLRVRRARWSRSYRLQLSAALLAFFIAPAAIFAVWAWVRLQDDDRAARELLVRETLRVAAAEQFGAPQRPGPSSTGAPLFLYRGGLMVGASDPLLAALAPLGRLLPEALVREALREDAAFATQRVQAGGMRTLVGYRTIGDVTPTAAPVVLATPARGDEYALDGRREDLGILALFVALLGALAAIWSSGIAARALARPLGALREAALALAVGRPAPALGAAPASELAPVYRAFGRMAADLAQSRAALEAAQRRTAAVLQHVASGVLAFMESGEILLANPRVEALLGMPVKPGPFVTEGLPPNVRAIAERARAFLQASGDEEAFDVVIEGRQLRARLTRFTNGAVLTLDDITELASAQRVLAWGEMARQVAHEIKNPLTPIRLGVQHLRRAYRDGRGDFGQILDTNVARVLAEIDHLDEIARAFSRYGTAPDDQVAPVAVEVVQVVRDVVALEELGEPERAAGSGGSGAPVQWLVNAPADVAWAFARGDELREVILNLLENARLASATVVTVAAWQDGDSVHIDVTDDGEGIAPDVLPRIFEPHFSTRTSGSGLGLAISRRLVEGWGGNILVDSVRKVGTRVRISLRAADERARIASTPPSRGIG